jgi:hypothetical protein
MHKIDIQETPVVEGRGSVVLSPLPYGQQRDLMSNARLPGHNTAEHDGVMELRFSGIDEKGLYGAGIALAGAFHDGKIKVVHDGSRFPETERHHALGILATIARR